MVEGNCKSRLRMKLVRVVGTCLKVASKDEADGWKEDYEKWPLSDPPWTKRESGDDSGSLCENAFQGRTWKKDP